MSNKVVHIAKQLLNINEVGKYRKKSTAKGQPRSKHKHIYETVLLITPYQVPNVATGKQMEKEHRYPTRVCTICGRVADIDYDDKWYNKEEHKHLKWIYFTKELSDAALKLPVWVRNDYCNKFAIPMEDKNE